MPTLPVRYPMGQFTIVFFKQYRQLGIFSFETNSITAIHSLTNGRKISIDTSTNELVLDTAPTGTFFKTMYSMDNASIALSDCCLIVGTGDGRGGTAFTDTYTLTNASSCPTVIIKCDTANQLSISTACGDASCSLPKTECKSHTAVNANSYN